MIKEILKKYMDQFCIANNRVLPVGCYVRGNEYLGKVCSLWAILSSWRRSLLRGDISAESVQYHTEQLNLSLLTFKPYCCTVNFVESLQLLTNNCTYIIHIKTLKNHFDMFRYFLDHHQELCFSLLKLYYITLARRNIAPWWWSKKDRNMSEWF